MSFPFWACFSMSGPPGNPSPSSLANVSRKFPMPMSRVSPKMRYFPSVNAMIWVFAPDA